MKFRASFLVLFLVAVTMGRAAAPEYPKYGPDIYDREADGFVQIASALQQTKAEHKNVLLDFGANWCPWCHQLHHLFVRDPAIAATLARDFVVVMIDVNQRHGVKRNLAVDEKYGHPIAQGLPVLVVLDAEGRALTTQETGALEDGKDAHDPAKVAAFLARWAPKR